MTASTEEESQESMCGQGTGLEGDKAGSDRPGRGESRRRKGLEGDKLTEDRAGGGQAQWGKGKAGKRPSEGQNRRG